MRDYKLPIEPTRQRRTGRARVFAALGLLGVTLATVRFVDLSQAAQDFVAPLQAEAVSIPLTLPASSDATTATTTPPSDNGIDAPTRPAGISLAAVDPRSEQNASEAPSLLEAQPATEGEATPEPEPTNEVAQSATEEQPEDARWIEHVIGKGESMARVFESHRLSARTLHRIVTASKEAKSLSRIQPGQKLRLLVDEDGELARLELHRSPVEYMRVAISDDDIAVETISKAVEKRVGSAAGVIESSLFVDGQKSGLTDGQIMELATIFGWDIDFALEIRAGDQFRVLYEQHYLDGEKLADGPILAAEFINRGTVYRAVRYEEGQGDVGYFDADGQSKRRAFIRTPIKFARVSSGFNPRRWHPVLQKWRSHKGVDYAAPTGTPVKATGDGRVVFRGTKGGYGKTVIIEHAGTYTTLYAHLSQYSKRAAVGKRVKQGQVIGYVGKTGLASGPHLHYEFRVNGVHRDPLRVKLPTSLSLPKSEIAKFHEVVEPLLAQLEAIPTDTMVASVDTPKTP